jgi:thiamine biosynthesis lipoprotein
MQQIHRRRFFWLFGAAGGAAAWSRLGSLTAGDQPLANTKAEPPSGTSGSQPTAVTRSGRALGSEVCLTLFHADRDAAEAALDAAFGELELIESLLSLYRAESQLSRLNRDGRLDDPHPYLVQVLRAAQTMSRRTQGAFDATVQPLWNVYARAYQCGRLPSAEEVDHARQCVGWERVALQRSSIQLRGEGTALTFNGIAQGFAADRVAATLADHGVRRALVDTGEISASGAKPQGHAWRVGIQHPRNEDTYIALARLSGRCLATSGDYATVFADDYSQHHLFDPHTGRSPTALSSVSIAAASAMQADALSTAVFVLGPEAGLELVKTEPSCDALLVLNNGRTLVTEGFPLVRTARE